MTMKKQHMQFYTILLCILFMMSLLVYAAEDREKITQIPLSFEYSFETGSSNGDISVTTGSNEFYIDEVMITNEGEDWKSGERPRIKIYLIPEKDYYFSTTKASSFTLTGDDADFVSATLKDSKTTMIVTIKLDKLKSDDLTVDHPEWVGNSSTGSWDEHKDAKYYQVKLYCNDTYISSMHTTYDTSYDFSALIKKSGDYTFRVRAVDHNSDKGSWEESGDWSVSNAMVKELADNISTNPADSSSSTSDSSGPGVSGSHWRVNHIGWWYQYPNGSYPTNQWLLINQQWYFFDSTGYMKTGWVIWQNLWYYCDSNGVMLTNTTTPDGFPLDPNGVWVQ